MSLFRWSISATSAGRGAFRRWFAIGGLLFGLVSCQQQPMPSVPGEQGSAQSVSVADRNSDAAIVAFCSRCHAMPPATSFPADAWYSEVQRGFDFYYQSELVDTAVPDVQKAVDYFRSRAPKTLMMPTAGGSSPSPLQFRRLDVAGLPTERSPKPVAVSFLSAFPGAGRTIDVFFSDMANGHVGRAEWKGDQFQLARIGQMEHPVAITHCDLNGNGRNDLVVAELGSFQPADHHRGRIVWFPDFLKSEAGISGVTLLDSVGRVCDVQAADFDDDGDLDLIVAEFGWHKTGRILFLQNIGHASQPKFQIHVVDPRPGTIHVPIVDLNQDGRPDFVALISQEVEVIEAFLNRGDGTFEKRRIYSAGDPAFGSSGIQIVDLDADGDDDVLYTNGDMFDSLQLKPYHGVRWLENKGKFPFEIRPVSHFAGALRALAGDLDQDGDLDLIATAFLPAEVRYSPSGHTLDSLAWFEQVQPGEFVRHSLESGNGIHAALSVSDIDGDGALDVISGSYRDGKPGDQSAFTFWRNEGRSQVSQP